jgi:hypothetical protein
MEIKFGEEENEEINSGVLINHQRNTSKEEYYIDGD